MGIVESQSIFSDNGWGKIRLKSDTSIKAWIDKEMKGKTCLVLLIGSETASRKWVHYEIELAWRQGIGVVGIYINNLKDYDGNQSTKGQNPLTLFCIDRTLNYIAKHSTPANCRRALFTIH